MKKRIIVTTSWDDGHKLDKRVAQLLKKYNIKGTFYVSPQEREFPKSDLLTDSDIKALSKDFEIGAHTMTHPHLSRISMNEAEKEISESKIYLEKITGKKITAFCYPYGSYNKNVVKLVKKNNFLLARTVTEYSTNLTSDKFTVPTTIECHRISLPNLIKEMHALFVLSNKNIVETIKFLNWEYLAKYLFDYCVKNGGVYHLWGHSWVLEKWNEWEKFERVLAYISEHKDIEFVTNSELTKMKI
ncbi:MAG TPA: polysaccharide deacetylase family protein [Candidatus Saccharimonadales bacterium]|nr:polysaccharide deacetylase family protein [Candidatus Saccharimonadales bacterium]